MFSKITRVALLISLIAFFLGTIIIATGISVGMGQTTSDVVAHRIALIGAILFYPGLAGFVIIPFIRAFFQHDR